ncbi:MAG: hypothetical protein EOM87_07525 [Clostridia bacterium]|nr:hypothetical protein [Clostridia bacterium]
MGVLFAFGLIPFIQIAVWIAFGLSVLTLILLVVGVLLGAVTAPGILSKCLCNNLVCLLVGIFGTLLVSLAALSIVLTPAFVLVTALVALGAAFFTILIISIICFIACFLC